MQKIILTENQYNFLLNESEAYPFSVSKEGESYIYSFTISDDKLGDIEYLCSIYPNPWQKYYYDFAFITKKGQSTKERVGGDLGFMNSVLKTIAECIIDFIGRKDIVKIIAFEGDRIRERAYSRFFKRHPYFSQFEIDDTYTKSGFVEIHVNKGIETIEEKWSQKYKNSIDCNNPKGFSQKAHCQGKKNKFLNETYKLTFQDKQDIEKDIRDEYNGYLKDITNRNKETKKWRNIIDNVKGKFSEDDYNAFLDSFGLIARREIESPMRYNEFYSKNKKSMTEKFINRKKRDAPTTFNYPMKAVIEDIDEYYQNLSKEELSSIKKFLRIVAIRIASGAGESIDRKLVRDAFFNTPTSFQKMFSEKPNSYLWRGDYSHPSDEDYDKEDKDYLSMQSFSIYKNVAQSFGSHFSASNIKSYGGSFSVPKFLEYGNSPIIGSTALADDEGEVMFFDVKYK
jgi:hypothetical protein